MIVSVIISTYNAGESLRKAIDSVFFQDFFYDIELLIVDGCSTDNTIDILKENFDRISWWISEEDSGIYDAWNKAILHAKGDWIVFLGADDVFYDKNVIGKFYEKTKMLKKDIDIVYGMVALTDKSGETWLLAGEPWDKFFKKFKLKAQMLPHQGVFHNRRIFDQGLRFNSSFKVAGDYELLLRVFKDNAPFFLHDLIVAKMQIGGVSSDFNSFKLHREFMQARKNNGYPETIWTLLLRSRYFLRGLIIELFGAIVAKKFNNFFRHLQGKPSLPEDDQGDREK